MNVTTEGSKASSSLQAGVIDYRCLDEEAHADCGLVSLSLGNGTNVGLGHSLDFHRLP